jgi:hypothetical protein
MPPTKPARIAPFADSPDFRVKAVGYFSEWIADYQNEKKPDGWHYALESDDSSSLSIPMRLIAGMFRWVALNTLSHK